MTTDVTEVAASLGRECGDCSMCCKLLEIADADIAKPRNQWCKHCKPGSGCTIYDTRPQLESTKGVPKKWSSSSPNHKNNFETLLAAALDAVHIRAISAQGKVIEKSFGHMISKLGLAGLTRSTVKNNKPYVQFGPFTKTKLAASPDGTFKQGTEPATFSLASNQAIPLIPL
jgi:hypothetical protein